MAVHIISYDSFYLYVILSFSLLYREGTQREIIPSQRMSYFLSVHINYLQEVRSLKVRINMMTVLRLLLLVSVF